MTVVRHHFTVDVEEYFQVSALEPYVPRSSWATIPSRVEPATDRLLDLMAEFEAGGTFFVLGLVAKRNPGLVRRIADAGHEVASHGWDHRRVTQLTPEEFRIQVRDSKRELEDLVGEAVLGYRAPSFSIVPGKEWALEILVEEGYGYDSSLYPVRRRGYGYPGGGRGIHELSLKAGSLIEVPPATLRILGAILPAGGGGTFRHLPYALTRAAFQSGGASDPTSATFYLHPWELDEEQPRVAGASLITRLRHYGGLQRTVPRLRKLLGEFRFQSVAATLASSGSY